MEVLYDVGGVIFRKKNTLIMYNLLINACIGCPVCPFDSCPVCRIFPCSRYRPSTLFRRFYDVCGVIFEKNTSMIYNLLITACIGCPVCPFDSSHVCISLRPSELLYRIHYILLAFSGGFKMFVACFSAKVTLY